MFKSKGMNVLFFISLAVILGTAAAFFITSHVDRSSAQGSHPDIDEIVKNLTVSTGEITTNIEGDHFIKVNFRIQVSSKDAKDELSKRSFQVKNAVIYIVSGMKVSDLRDQKGLAVLENQIKDRINTFLNNGRVIHVYTTEKIIQ
ncbi:MAG: flagellar basal body-associated FliL family protein [Sporolactobacillus sp.]|jgi:flagellar FliL protein|nr:flagellar basal body-associated FliL family protein [Sporolactobacillus sp.]MCI1882362.1 flagellar basal body-associated FliL family protein [Sporolactobacillus sp.]